MKICPPISNRISARKYDPRVLVPSRERETPCEGARSGSRELEGSSARKSRKKPARIDCDFRINPECAGRTLTPCPIQTASPDGALPPNLVHHGPQPSMQPQPAIGSLVGPRSLCIREPGARSGEFARAARRTKRGTDEVAQRLRRVRARAVRSTGRSSRRTRHGQARTRGIPGEIAVPSHALRSGLSRARGERLDSR